MDVSLRLLNAEDSMFREPLLEGRMVDVWSDLAAIFQDLEVHLHDATHGRV